MDVLQPSSDPLSPVAAALTGQGEVPLLLEKE